MDPRETVREAFPELRDIEDDDLRARTLDAWAATLEETGVEDLEAVPWYPPEQKRLGIPDERLVPHLRDVAEGGVALAEVLVERRDAAVDVDTVIAGALLHDVGKLYEFDGMEATPIGDRVGHPYYGLYAVGKAGLGAEIANVVVSHTPVTNVEPATLEAELVRLADAASAAAIRLRGVEDLREV